LRVLEAEAEIARRLAHFEESDRGRSAIYHFIAKETENFEVVMLSGSVGSLGRPTTHAEEG